MPARGRSAGGRRGQAEVIGGLVVLTLIFLFALPLVLYSFTSTQRVLQGAEAKQAEVLEGVNERLAIQPLSPSVEMYQRLGWIPGVFINNTGVTEVTLDKLYLIFTGNQSIYAILDLRYLRPTTSPLVKYMLLDVALTSGGLTWKDPPPPGVPITLKPGGNILIVFSESLLSLAPNLIVRVESASGILHPLGGSGAGDTLMPSEAAGPGGALAETGGLWRGVFYPQSGFQLRGADSLLRDGIVKAWVPPIYVYPDIDRDSEYEPVAMYYYESFIYDDPDYPGLARVEIKFRLVYTGFWPRYYVYLWVVDARDGWPRSAIMVWSGWTIELRGFVGTYDTLSEGTYFNGYAFEVIVRDQLGRIVYWYPRDWGVPSLPPLDLGSAGITRLDFDGNGVEELVFYSHLNGPLITVRQDIDADDLAYTWPSPNDELRDALVWTYVVARDISGVDFIRVTVKSNYYWTNTFYSCPSGYRTLNVMGIAVLKYDAEARKWVIHQFKNFEYTSTKPVQFQPSVTFPVERNGTYRVAVFFYDNYRDWDFNYECWKDFTFTLEHVVVEYGVINPFLEETPPVYIVAIPDPSLIRGLGEEEYAALKGISVEEAKIMAQKELLELIEQELAYAGISGYTVITSVEMLYDVLMGSDYTPKYAIVIWLQGEVPVTEALSAYLISDRDVLDRIMNYRWVLAWAVGEPLGDSGRVPYYLGGLVAVEGPGLYELNITDDGLRARGEFYAFYLFNTLTFNYTTYTLTASPNYCVVPGSAFYASQTSPVKYGTVAYWANCLEGAGAILFNPVHVDWDRSGVGVQPETLAQQVVYASLYAWQTLRGAG